jgi:hypothetical protein
MLRQSTNDSQVRKSRRSDAQTEQTSGYNNILRLKTLSGTTFTFLSSIDAPAWGLAVAGV